MITDVKVRQINKKGQAMFEFVIFLPFVIVLFKMFLNIGGAINGSINQQKTLRGYFYHTLRGSSYFPSLKTLDSSWKTFSEAGFYAIGFSETLIDDKPISPCYKIEPFFGPDVDKCLERPKNNKSQFIKPKTMYGLCGAHYRFQADKWMEVSRSPGNCTTR
ncbi:MAG: hypothetical protein CME61_02280 [Halobacteriovoraceae bacterium]|nr:hypothetical protein [Halobacteriovoraceae bacterium]|tara:strand:+ start:62 stop:544 length:483 start_codon:yes stop_codon:yes gene_type:complete